MKKPRAIPVIAPIVDEAHFLKHFGDCKSDLVARESVDGMDGLAMRWQAE